MVKLGLFSFQFFPSYTLVTKKRAHWFFRSQNVLFSPLFLFFTFFLFFNLRFPFLLLNYWVYIFSGSQFLQFCFNFFQCFCVNFNVGRHIPASWPEGLIKNIKFFSYLYYLILKKQMVILTISISNIKSSFTHSDPVVGSLKHTVLKSFIY
jgi:hypothetical protein